MPRNRRAAAVPAHAVPLAMLAIVAALMVAGFSFANGAKRQASGQIASPAAAPVAAPLKETAHARR